MIRHCVMLGLPDDHDAAELGNIMQGLGDLTEHLSGCGNFLAGANIDVEGKSSGFPFGFTIDFDDTAALQVYADHPEHKKLGARLVALCGGGGKITVFDLQEYD
ncbi:MAG: Dabb family protein [Sulfitobacter sp.]